jgi:hypothetical protein
MTTKTKIKKRVLRFGDFIAAVYHSWDRRRAGELVQVAVNAHLVVFEGRQHFVIWEES